MARDASELARRLACEAEAVCRHYLSNGRRQGRYWTVGDVRNAPGRSMFVRLNGPESGPGAAGHWTDAASAEYGDLLDVIRASCGFTDFRDVAEEARRFLRLPRVEPHGVPKPVRTPVPAGSPKAARRLFAMSQPIRRTLVENYLRNRGIKAIHDAGALRFHPRCYYRSTMFADRDLAGDDRRRHRSRQSHHRGASNLARSQRLRCRPAGQGSDRHPKESDGRSPRPCRPLWRGR